ncbi:MAG: ATP-grasp domain-containing protein [Fibrobacteria bacterium]|nr:ATP-grasp domain-containing protein [Fibrobacteria bacterium]
MSVISKALELGYKVVTADNVPSNPGHRIAHSYFEANIIDADAIRWVARQCHADGILCTSDTAAPTAALVCQDLGLPTHPPESVALLCDKPRFRAFLAANDFSTPVARGFTEGESPDLSHFRFPIVVKPADSSGSKGVVRLDSPEGMEQAISYALTFSRSSRYIVEEFVQSIGYAMSGDGFSWKGKLAFRCFNNDHRVSEHPLVPIALSTPFQHPRSIQERMHSEIQRAFDLLEMQSGCYNFDVRIRTDGEPILMEIAPRAGSNLIPELAQLATGVDMVSANVRQAVGDDCSDITMVEPKGFWSSYVIHSDRVGTFEGLEIDEKFEAAHVVRWEPMQDIGTSIHPLENVAGTIGLLQMKFDNEEQMLERVENLSRWVKVRVG